MSHGQSLEELRGDRSVLRDGAFVIEDPKLLPALQTRAQNDLRHLQIVIERFAAEAAGAETEITASAAANTARYFKENPAALEVIVPMFNTGYTDENARGWFLRNDGEQLILSQNDRGAYWPDQRVLVVRATEFAVPRKGAWEFTRYADEQLARTMIHELQHHFERDPYPLTSFAGDHDIVQFRHEFRARFISGQDDSSSPATIKRANDEVVVLDPVALGLDDDRRGRAFCHALAYPRRVDSGSHLFDVYERDADFRDACHAFADRLVTESINPVNSPAIDALYGHLEAQWPGIVILGGAERPWATLEAHIAALSPFEASLISESKAWERFLEEHLVDDEHQRFEAQIAERRGG